MEHQPKGQRAGISVTHITTATLLDQGQWALKQDKRDVLSLSLTQNQTSKYKPSRPPSPATKNHRLDSPAHGITSVAITVPREPRRDPEEQNQLQKNICTYAGDNTVP